VTGQTEKLALNGASRTARNGADEKQLCVRGNLDSDGAEKAWRGWGRIVSPMRNLK
jgi:hypothetical protein